MAKQQYYRQCALIKQIDDKYIREMLAWIPEQFAKAGKYLEILEGDEWVNGWKVKKAYIARLNQQDMQERSRDYKHTREASDV